MLCLRYRHKEGSRVSEVGRDYDFTCIYYFFLSLGLGKLFAADHAKLIASLEYLDMTANLNKCHDCASVPSEPLAWRDHSCPFQ
jgi:hypothetical protein